MKYEKIHHIDAVQLGDDPAGWPPYVLHRDGREVVDSGYLGDPDDVVGWIETLEGGLIALPGDWIATGVDGEHWPIKPEIFAKTYRPYVPQHDEALRLLREAEAKIARYHELLVKAKVRLIGLDNEMVIEIQDFLTRPDVLAAIAPDEKGGA